MKTVILKSNAKHWEDGERAICATLDKAYFELLTDEQKATYTASFEPTENGEYDFIAKHKEAI
ncbi:hypothetical protein [Staphylococcus equorum]|uniref:Uncharacterized protein n=1 Tax=Staphylococcus equorum TaxID=246432 RepID=A0AAP7IGH3_9STAP|nr:hypothetical protein [Staphylococcus equorum]OEK58948.1 hypothetical protein ASS94_01075 [Staphylococcus equorum]